jgi:hypothetical protein
MKRTILITILLIVIGNCIIMFLEKILLLQSDMELLQNNLFSATAGSDVSKIYPPIILSKKILIWLTAFTSINTILYFVKMENKSLTKYILIGFYLIGCLANVIIVPHPLWFIIATIGIVVAPFFVVEGILSTIKIIASYTKKHLHRQNQYNTNLT